MSRSAFHMMRYARRLLCLLLCASACAPTVVDEINGIGDAGAGPRPGAMGLDPAARGYAVVSGDYAVTSVGLLKSDGSVRVRDFINSGSAPTGLVTALSGDVVLPTRSGERGVLTLLDRFRADVVTRIDLGSGEILGQLRTEAGSADTGSTYSSNPHDYVYIDARSAWVSRYNPKIGAKRTDPDLGIDLLRVDPTDLVRTQERVDFSPWNAVVQRDNPETGVPEKVTVYARPSKMVRLGEYLVVGIESLGAAFDALGDGMVALVDLTSRHVSMLELPGMQNCGDLAPVPDDSSRVAVACTGFFRGAPRETSGLVMLLLDGDHLVIEQNWHAKDHPDAALTMYDVRALSATEVLATAVGEAALLDADGVEIAPEQHDKLYRVDLASGEQHLVLEADGRYVIGSTAFDPRSKLLLVPDASTDKLGRPSAGVRRFVQQQAGSFKALGLTKLDGILPARQVRAFY